MASLLAFIIGAGPHLGKHIALHLRDKGFVVIVGSRHPEIHAPTGDNLHPIRVDASCLESIQRAFEQVNHDFGPPNVVICNAAFSPVPSVPTHPLSLDVGAFNNAIAVGSNIFAIAQLAYPGFCSPQHRDHPRAFIVTGSMHPFLRVDAPRSMAVSIQKAIAARLVEHFAHSYKEYAIRFYFASLVSPTGVLPDQLTFDESGATHAKVYDMLIHSEEQWDWDYRFNLHGKRMMNDS